jgi:hypothetical protein
MHENLDILIEIPCFKCLFWNPKKESSLYCDPNVCEELTSWLLNQIEKQSSADEATADTSTLVVDVKRST